MLSRCADAHSLRPLLWRVRTLRPYISYRTQDHVLQSQLWFTMAVDRVPFMVPGVECCPIDHLVLDQHAGIFSVAHNEMYLEHQSNRTKWKSAAQSSPPFLIRETYTNQIRFSVCPSPLSFTCKMHTASSNLIKLAGVNPIKPNQRSHLLPFKMRAASNPIKPNGKAHSPSV